MSAPSSHTPQRPAPRVLQTGPPRPAQQTSAGSATEPRGSSAEPRTALHEGVDEEPASLDANLAALASLTRYSNPGRSIVAARASGRVRGSAAAGVDGGREFAEPLSARRAQAAGGALPEPTAGTRFGGLAQGSWNPTTAAGGLSSRNAATYMQGVDELLRADSDAEARSRSATRSPSPPRAPRRDSPQRTGARRREASPLGNSSRTQRSLDQLPLLRPSR